MMSDQMSQFSDFQAPPNAWNRSVQIPRPPPIEVKYWKGADAYYGQATIKTSFGDLQFIAKVPIRLVTFGIAKAKAYLKKRGDLRHAMMSGLFADDENFIVGAVTPHLTGSLQATVEQFVPVDRIIGAVANICGYTLDSACVKACARLIIRAKWGDKKAASAIRQIYAMSGSDQKAQAALQAINLIAPAIPYIAKQYVVNGHDRADSIVSTFAGALSPAKRSAVRDFFRQVQANAPRHSYN